MEDNHAVKSDHLATAQSMNKKPEQKQNPKEDRPIKRIPLPASANLLLSLDLPFDMVDSSIYLDILRRCLLDFREIAKNNKLKDLEESLENAANKCRKMMNNSEEALKKSKKEKDISDYELVEMMKKVNSYHSARVLERPR